MRWKSRDDEETGRKTYRYGYTGPKGVVTAVVKWSKDNGQWFWSVHVSEKVFGGYTEYGGSGHENDVDHAMLRAESSFLEDGDS